MGFQTMVFKESIVMERKDRRFAHKNFRTLTTAFSLSAEEANSDLSKVTGLMKDLMTPSVGKLFLSQVETAYICLRSGNTRWSVCSTEGCKICEDNMTNLQQRAVNGRNNVLVFHMTMWRGDTEEDVSKKYTSLGEEWDDLHSSIPTMKYTRIITAEEISPGKFVFMCSCGFDFRYQGTCRHISLLLLHASDGQCAGCEIENIALRNTAAYAACRHDQLPQVGVWAGVCCGRVTEDSLRNCPCPCDEDDGAGDEQAVMTSMKTNNEHALAKLHITQSGHRGEMQN
jgi:hypothetical protein